MVTHPIHVVKIKKAALTMMGQLTFVLMEVTETLLRREHSVLPLPLPPTLFPPDYTPTGPNGEIPTATPYPGEGRPPSAFVTPTPLPISRTTDLAPQLPDEKKSVYIIGRSDGTYEKFLISVYYAGDVKELLKFGPGDVLLYHYLLKPREVIPIEMTAVPANGAVTETPQSP